MQGRLRGQKLTAVVETTCGQTGRELELETDGSGFASMSSETTASGADPFVFVPDADLERWPDRTILDGF